MLVAGRPLAAGKYSLWAVPQPGEWTVIFSKAADTFHVPYPEGQDALRIAVKDKANQCELFTPRVTVARDGTANSVASAHAPPSGPAVPRNPEDARNAFDRLFKKI